MASPSKQKSTSTLLNSHWSNRSHSSILTTSDTATFHSARAPTPSSHMEMSQMAQRPSTQSAKPRVLSQVESIRMSRQDSGYSDASKSPTLCSLRTSTSTSTSRLSSPSKAKRRTHSHGTSTSRLSTKRSARPSPLTTQLPRSCTSRRPSMQSRSTVPYQNQVQNQFFHFPSLAPEPPSPPRGASPTHQYQAPPSTVQYWTSGSTRRLEYAAIDAASKGVKGFLIRMVPDCILPKEKRRPRFCDGDEGSEAGSVRRYRLELPEEKGVSGRVQECGKNAGGGIRRWIGLGRRNTLEQ